MSEEEIAVVVDKHRPASEGWEVLTFVNPVELQSIRAVRITYFFVSGTFGLSCLGAHRFQRAVHE